MVARHIYGEIARQSPHFTLWGFAVLSVSTENIALSLFIRSLMVERRYLHAFNARVEIT